MGDENQWYTNKELFEQISRMQGDFKDLRHEMRETRNIIKQYNGLREELGVVKEKVEKIEARTEGKRTVSEGIRNWGGWIFALITLLILLGKTFV